MESCPWTSARLTTRGKVALTRGRVEVRAKLPTGTGLLPAIWMLGDNGVEWPGQGEIDICEVVGGEPRTVYGTAHGPTYHNENGIGETATLTADASTAFHTYAVDKQPHRITWSVDGRPYFTLTPPKLPSPRDWVFEQDMHLLLNVAVGGDWPGPPDASTPSPATMTVDYVRLYGEGHAGEPGPEDKAGHPVTPGTASGGRRPPGCSPWFRSGRWTAPPPPTAGRKATPRGQIAGAPVTPFPPVPAATVAVRRPMTLVCRRRRSRTSGRSSRRRVAPAALV
ncbi:glycoside hydrolase family 16 protein [Streptomyces sp. G35A]